MSPSSTISSPCMRLNDDVLQEIFIHCVCSSGNYYSITSEPFNLHKDHKNNIRRLPQLSVSQVCSSWRHVSLLTPWLWNNIYIYDWTEDNIRIAREYLSRAANLPISIWLRPQQGEIEESWQSQVIEFLSSYRIGIAEISNVDLILPKLPQRSVADLQIVVGVFFDRDRKMAARIDLNDTRYPKLAVIGDISISGSSSSLRVFDGLRLPMTVKKGWDLLRRCPSLEECWLTITQRKDRRSGRSGSVPQIHLQHLRKLSLDYFEYIGPPFFSAFVKALTLPVIEEIEAACDELALPALQSLAHRSNHFPHLIRLRVAYSTSVVDVGALLVLAPSLTSLSISRDGSVTFDIPTLNGLASGLLAPRLQNLDLGQVSNVGLFLDMVESRMKNAQISSNGVPAPLTDVRLLVHGRQDYDRLREMQQRGIPIMRL